MEILIAILWYMHLLMPGTSYTQTELNQILQANQPAIQTIQQDTRMTNQILNDYKCNADNQSKQIIEEWTDPPPKPILD